MPLLNDKARCQGVKKIDENRATGVRFEWQCTRRKTCARYVERYQGGPRTMTYAYLCDGEDDMYIPAGKPNVQDALPC